MTNRQSILIRGCLLSAVALLSMPHPAVAAVPGVGAPKTESHIRSAEPLTMSAPQAQANCQDQHGTNFNPAVVPPCASPFGATYPEWSVSWWQWFFSLTVTPDGVHADCSTHQNGPVWFLLAGSAINCTVPSGKALFFPIINVECSSLEDPPFFGQTAADRHTCASSVMDTVTGLAVEIDGVALRDLTNYRAASPDFAFTVPDGNIAQVPTDKSHSGRSSADGFYLMLTPLTPGTHTIHFTGTIPPFSFTIDTTYRLTVQPGR